MYHLGYTLFVTKMARLQAIIKYDYILFTIYSLFFFVSHA